MAIQKAIKPTIIKSTLTEQKPLLDLRNKNKNLSIPFIAGLLDSDGFIISYKHTCEFMITAHEEDQLLLEQIKNQFGGDIRKVPNKKAIRFHLNSKNSKDGINTLFNLTKSLNGHIRNNVRISQFKKACDVFSIEFVVAMPISTKNGYIAGLFCADGAIYLKSRPSSATKISRVYSESLHVRGSSSTAATPQLIEERIQRLLIGVSPRAEISIVSKFISNINDIAPAFGFGSFCFRKGHSIRGPQGSFAFRIYKEADIHIFVNYMEEYRSCSIKHNKLDLVKEIYELRNQKAHLSSISDPVLFAKWEAVIRKWFEKIGIINF